MAGLVRIYCQANSKRVNLVMNRFEAFKLRAWYFFVSQRIHLRELLKQLSGSLSAARLPMSKCEHSTTAVYSEFQSKTKCDGLFWSVAWNTVQVLIRPSSSYSTVVSYHHHSSRFQTTSSSSFSQYFLDVGGLCTTLSTAVQPAPMAALGEGTVWG